VTGQGLDAAVKVRLRLSSTVASERVAVKPEGSPTTAAINLTFYLKDSNGILLKKEELLANDLEKGAGTNSTVHEVAFPARFEPGKGYYLVIGGRTDVQAAKGESVNCSLAVTECSMEIGWQAAPTKTATPPAATQPTSPTKAAS
jgi:hypothetical protein